MAVRSIPDIFRSEESRAAYAHLMDFADGLGGVEVQEKKTCIHLAAGGAAFLGVHPRKSGIRLTIPLSRKLDGPRIVKCEQASKARFHNEVDLMGGGPVDAELSQWIAEAHALRVG